MPETSRFQHWRFPTNSHHHSFHEVVVSSLQFPQIGLISEWECDIKFQWTHVFSIGSSCPFKTASPRKFSNKPVSGSFQSKCQGFLRIILRFEVAKSHHFPTIFPAFSHHFRHEKRPKRCVAFPNSIFAALRPSRKRGGSQHLQAAPLETCRVLETVGYDTRLVN